MALMLSLDAILRLALNCAWLGVSNQTVSEPGHWLADKESNYRWEPCCIYGPDSQGRACPFCHDIDF